MDLLSNVLEEYGDTIINLYRRKLYEGRSNSSGLLGNSVGCTIKTEDGLYELSLNLQDYWKYVEYGRKAGTMPNIEDIKNWIRMKPVIARSVPIPNINSLSYLIARSIKRKGIRPKNYLQSVLNEIKDDPELNKAITKDIEKKVDLIFRNF